jgi:phosphate/phosphite/phosphonate ABC transporter binding protein
MKLKFLLIITVCVVLLSCSFLNVNFVTPTATPVELAVTVTDTAPPPLPTPELGLVENPLILALTPGATQDQVTAAKTIADQFTQRTGYTVVTVVPDSYTALVEALAKGNAHIVLLDAFSYELAYQKGLVRAAYAVVKDGKVAYASQFIASKKGGFKSYFNEASETNSADASVALAQFNDKKPCWSDETSASGYVIPLGILNKNQIVTSPPAFVQGHPTVVRSIYLGSICDFGATYVDARKFPSLEDQYPDLMEQVIVVWRTPEIIPYAVLAFSTSMPSNMRDLFTTLVPAILQTDNGKAAFKTAFNIEELQPVNDSYFADFHDDAQKSLADFSKLLK